MADTELEWTDRVDVIVRGAGSRTAVTVSQILMALVEVPAWAAIGGGDPRYEMTVVAPPAREVIERMRRWVTFLDEEWAAGRLPGTVTPPPAASGAGDVAG